VKQEEQAETILLGFVEQRCRWLGATKNWAAIRFGALELMRAIRLFVRHLRASRLVVAGSCRPLGDIRGDRG